MPRLIDPNARETTELHADWWSPARWGFHEDGTPNPAEAGHPRHGKFKEYAEVYAQMTAADQEWVSRQVMRLARFTKKDARRGMSSEEFAANRRFTLLRLVLTLTDETGARLPITEESLKRLPERDAGYLIAELDEMNDVSVPTLPEDELAAERKGEAVEDVAEAAFR